MRYEFSTDPAEFEARAAHDAIPSATAERIVAAVEALPTQLREIVNAQFYEQISHPAIQRRLNIPPATYWRRWAEAKKRLAKALSDLDPVGEMPADQ